MLSTSSLLRRTLLTAASRTALIRSPSLPLPQAPLQTPSSSSPRSPTTNITLSKPLSHPRFFHPTAATMVVHNITSKEEFDKALSDHKVMVVDFFATWCGPCKVIAPKVADFSKTYEHAHFVKVDVDEVPDVAQEHHIRAMPTFLLFKDGAKVGEVVGANPPALEAAIKEALKA